MYEDIAQGRTQDLEFRGAPVAYPGFQRGGCLRSGPIRKVWGGQSTSGPIYEKWGVGDSPLQVRYTKSGGGGGDSPLQVRYTKSGGGGGGGGGSPLQVRYLYLAHRKYLNVPTYVLPRYTSHARANELKIHATGKG